MKGEKGGERMEIREGRGEKGGGGGVRGEKEWDDKTGTMT